MIIKNTTYKAKRGYHLVKTGLLKGFPAKMKYKNPQKKLTIIGITGTDGKTSSSTLLYHTLKTAGVKVALLSTVAAYFGDREIETGLHTTSPSPDDLYRLMSEMLEEGITHLVLEYTSHGAYQHRLWGISPDVVGVTNINHDHLDYHLNYDNYLEAKAILMKKAPVLVLNQDDKSFFKLKRVINTKKHEIISYSYEDSINKKINTSIKERFPEKFNQMNARLVTKIAQHFDIENKSIIKSMKTFPGIPGRMEFIPTKKNFEVIVDFAHTAQGLKAALTALRKRLNQNSNNHTTGRLIAVFGCAGLRDREKRPYMGQIGADLADIAIFTAEDPRTESIWSIIRQMKEQLTQDHNKVISIADRYQAIEYALTKVAKKGDIVAILGKGPEKSICYGTVEYPWSDKETVKEILNIKPKIKRKVTKK